MHPTLGFNAINKSLILKNPLVVGYKGEIGSYLLNGLLRIMPKALNIYCVDINETVKEVIDRIVLSNIIFLCVDINSTLNWIEKFKPYLKGKVIVEQCSLKEWIYESEITKDLHIVSMHILFRPSKTFDLKDKKVGVLKDQATNDPGLINVIEEITQAQIVYYDNVAEHDNVMALQQALIHRVLLTLSKTLRNTKGSTFMSDKVEELALRIKQGNKELYRSIQHNKYLPNVLNQFAGNLDNFDEYFDEFFK
jgi:prephenate dehydrogenase